MKTSVAMATYNGANYIREQLESILRQTMPIDELIICDDCSKDNTVSIVNEYIRANGLQGKWRIEVNLRNLGYGSNFMQAVKMTSGDLIFFCDQDDIWVDDRVEVMTSLMENHSGILMLGSEFEPFVCSKDAPSIPSWERAKLKGDGSLEHLKFRAKNIFIGCQGCSMCIRRSFLVQIQPYWYTGWAHDEYVWKLALCIEGAYIYHGITLKRRLHSTNVTMGKMRDITKRIVFLEELMRSHEAMLQFANDHHVHSKYLRLIEKNIKSVSLRIGLLKDKKYINTFKLVSKYFKYYHSQKSIPVELYMAIRG